MPNNAEVIFCGGFFIVYFVDEFIHYFFGEAIQHRHSENNHREDNQNTHRVERRLYGAINTESEALLQQNQR